MFMVNDGEYTSPMHPQGQGLSIFLYEVTSIKLLWGLFSSLAIKAAIWAVFCVYITGKIRVYVSYKSNKAIPKQSE